MKKPEFCIIGPGRLGTALAVLLHGAGWEFIGASGRSARNAVRACEAVGAGTPAAEPAALTAASRLVIITTPDDAINRVCREIASTDGFCEGSVVAHCSGLLSSSALAPARECGAFAGSLHPIQTFPTWTDAVRTLPGSCCCIEGDAEALKILCIAASDLNLKRIHVPADGKALYHAGAVAASNLLAALLDLAQELEIAAGLPPGDALEPFIPLVQRTVENISRMGTVRALTGPFSRGDYETIRTHIQHISAGCPQALPAYKTLGRRALELGVRQGGISEPVARSIRRLLDD